MTGTVKNSPHRGEKWHVGKEVPLALVFALILQVIVWVWWSASFSATVTTKLEDLSLQIASLSADKYTKNDASKDGALFAQRLSDVERRVDVIERKK